MAESSSSHHSPGVAISLNGDQISYRRRSGERQQVAVIGAGPAGLGALRRLALLPDTDIICFEQAQALGGTWLYTDFTGKDQFGVPVHSNLYKNLRTNLPKEVMHYPDYPYIKQDHSYVHAAEVLEYLNSFAQEYDLIKYIKLNNRVTVVKPLANLWSLSSMDLQTKIENQYIFDAILICSGPNITPVYPKIELAKFSGHQIHSKMYKVPDLYQNKTVLIIGLGPSGLDITYEVATVAKKVILSRNKSKSNADPFKFPENVTLKPSVSFIEEKMVTFDDETSEQIDAIIHCTGYTFNFPFLDSSCGITVDQYVFPLFMHFINIERPTMAFIGLLKYCPHLYMVDYQVQCFIKTLTKEVDLPSKEEMMAQYEKAFEEHSARDSRKKSFHYLGKELTANYFEQLAEFGKLDRIPPVQIAMFNEAFRLVITDFSGFRENDFRVIDQESFEVTKDVPPEE